MTVITIGARDVGALTDFYKGLGWAVSMTDNNDFAAFNTGGGMLCLYAAEKLAAESGVPPGFGGVTLAINVEAPELVDPTVEAWVAAGGRVRAQPEDRDFGGRSSYVEDPEGNVWEIVWAPHILFDERGAVRFE
jgi:uncharacterized glyoxalase superfamily protein PhnB